MDTQQILATATNPLDEPTAMPRLLKAYAASALTENFFAAVLHTTDKKNCLNFNAADKNRFHARMFNLWKQSVINVDQATYEKLHRQKIVGTDFLILQNYLKTIPDVHDTADIQRAEAQNYINDDLAWALAEYNWLQKQNGWCHVSSRYVTAKQDPYLFPQHRLYLNTEAPITYQMLDAFSQACTAQHLPYYFKYQEVGDADDTIVIFANDATLPAYYTILNQIIQQQPSLTQQIKHPPLLTGQLNAWLGYGLEATNAQNQSANHVRANCLAAAMDQVFINWIWEHHHPDDFITDHAQPVLFRYQLLDAATDYLIQKIKRQMPSGYNLNKPDNTLKNIRNANTYSTLSMSLDINLDSLLRKLVRGKAKDTDAIAIAAYPDEIYYFTAADLRNVCRSLSPDIVQADPTITTQIRQKINHLAPSYGIDPTNFFGKFSHKKHLQNIFTKQRPVNREL